MRSKSRWVFSSAGSGKTERPAGRATGALVLIVPAMSGIVTAEHHLVVSHRSLRRLAKEPAATTLPAHQTASLATFSGEALTDLLAGFAANCIGSLVKGLTPMRASVAGLFTTDIFTKPGMTNSPDSLSSL